MDYTARIVAEFDDKATPGVQKLRDEVNALRAAMSGSGGAGPSGASITKDAKQAQDSWSAVGSTIRSVALQIGALSLGRRLISDAVEFNSLMETSRLGIAATFLTFREYTDEKGRALSTEEQYNKAQLQSVHVQGLLQKEAFRSLATMKELTESYMRLQGAAGTQKATSEQLVDFVGTLSNYASAAGRNLNEVSQQMQMVLQGAARTSGVVGAFVRSLGISNNQLRAWRDQGVIIEKLAEQMKMYNRIGGDLNKTFAGVMSNLEDVSQQGSAAFAKPWMDKFREMGQAFIDSVTYVNNAGTDGEERGIRPDVLSGAGALGVVSMTNLDQGLAPTKRIVEEILRSFGAIRDEQEITFRGVAEFAVTFMGVISAVMDSVILTLQKTLMTIPVAFQKFIGGLGSIIGSENMKGWSAYLQKVFDPLYGGTYEEAWDRAAARTEAGLQQIADLYNKHVGIPAPGNGDPKKNDDAGGAIAEISQRWKELLATLDSSQSVAGLTGLDGELAKIEQSTGKAKAQVDKFVESLRGDTRPGMGGQYEKYAALAAGAKERLDAEGLKLTEAAVIKSYNEVEARLADYAKFNKDTAEDVIESERARTYAQIRGMAERDTAMAASEEQRARVEQARIKAIEDTDEYLKRKAEERTADEARRAKEKLLADNVTQSLSLKQWSAYEDALTELYVSKGENRTIAQVRAAKESAKDQLASAVTVSEGIAAAYATIRTEAGTAGQGIAASMLETWDTIGQGFTTLVFDVISGNLSDLGSVFSSMADGIMQTWAKTIKDMVAKAASAGGNMGFTGPLPEGETRSGGLLSGVLGVGGLLLGGYGVASGFAGGGSPGAKTGSYIGAGAGMLATAGLGLGMAGGAGLLTGATTAAVAGSVVPIVGTIVGAIVGLALASLLSGDSLMHAKGSIANMGGGSTSTWIDEREEMGPRGPVTIPGFWQTTQHTPANAFEQQGKDILDRQANSLLSIFQAGTEGGAAGLMANYWSALRDSIGGANFDVNAGGNDEIEAAFEYMTTTLIPRIGLSAAFGRYGYLPTGKQDGPGGIGNLSYGLPGMDENGQWIGPKQAYSEDSSMFKMLVGTKGATGEFVDGLGFTVERFAEIAAMIDLRDPATFLSWLTGLIGVVTGIKTLLTTDIVAEADKKIGQTPADAFTETRDDLKAAWDELGLVFGDDKITRGQELVALTDEYFQKQIDYVVQLKQLQNSINASTDEVIDAYSRLGETRDQRLKRTEDEGIWPLWGQLEKAVDPAEIERIVGAGQKAATAILDILVEKLQEAQAIAADLADVKSLFGEFGQVAADGVLGLRESVSGLFEDIAATASLSGDAQLEALRKVGVSAREIYTSLSSMLSAVTQNAADLTSSIAKQIWNIDYDAADEGDKTQMVRDRMQEILASIAQATSPAEIKALTDEYQGLASQYLNLFEADDPNLAAARDWAKQGLRTIDAFAHDVYEGMADEFRTMAANIFGALDGPIATTSDVIDGLNAEIERWKGFLDDIRDAANLKLGGMVDDMVAANAELLASIEANRLAFVSATNAVNTFAGGDANGEFSGVTSADRKLASFGSTADEAALALDRFIASLDAPRPGGATSNSTVTAAPPTTTARIVSTVRRYNGALTPRTY